MENLSVNNNVIFAKCTITIIKDSEMMEEMDDNRVVDESEMEEMDESEIVEDESEMEEMNESEIEEMNESEMVQEEPMNLAVLNRSEEVEEQAINLAIVNRSVKVEEIDNSFVVEDESEMVEEKPINLAVVDRSEEVEVQPINLVVADKNEEVGEKNTKKSRAAKPAKRVQKMRPIRDKLRIIGLVKRGHTKAYASRLSGVAESTIRGWMKAEDKLRKSLNAMTSMPSTSYDDVTSPIASTSSGISSDTSPIPSTSTRTNTDNIFMPSTSTGTNTETISMPGTSTGTSTNTTPIPSTSASSTSTGTSTDNVDQLSEPLPTFANPQGLWDWYLYQRSLMRAVLTTSVSRGTQTDETTPISGMEAAIYHGEQFLRWLEETAHPAVSRFMISQIRQMLEIMKASSKEPE